MRRVILDGALMRTEPQKYLAQVLEFPEYYGANLDALHDCLCEIAVPVEVQLIRWEYLGEQAGRYRQFNQFGVEVMGSLVRVQLFPCIPEGHAFRDYFINEY